MTKLTPQELDERIDSDLLDMWLLWERGDWYVEDGVESKYNDRAFREALKQYVKTLTRDCIEAVTPGQIQDFFGYNDRPELIGYNKAVDTIQANTKELLG